MFKLKQITMCMVIVAAFAVVLPAQDASSPTGWPRTLEREGNILVLYQPQVDDWKNFTQLEWRMAVSLTPAGGKPAVGVVVVKGDTEIDHDNKMVFITNLKIVNTYFSMDPPAAAQMDQLVRTFLPPAVDISLQRLVACIPKKDAVPGVPLKNHPPVIFVSYKPAILLDVDGQPVLAPIQNTYLQYMVNTQWPLFFEKSKAKYYLFAGQNWLQSGNLEGTWSLANNLPQDMDKVVSQSQWGQLKEFVPPPSDSNAAIPKVYYSTKPAEVILFDGQPDYVRIPGTQLVYAQNTTSYLFFYAQANRYYYLTAGRWFSANSLDGPWTFASSNLPADFSQIPPDSPAGQVLASVPGTEEAKDAVLLAQIPVTAVVNPAAAAQAKVTYDGDPNFTPIGGTSLSYATNTVQKVIQVGDQYYLCQQGVWFVSSSPQGPWQTAQSVPQQIYTIPPSCPVYNVTYVTQAATSDGSIQASYTGGYMGAFVMGAATGAVIAGGTGYYYQPYVAYPAYGYPAYHPYPATYGAMPYHNSVTGAYGVSQTAYGAYGSATRTASYNPYTGTAARTASVSTAYGSAAAGKAYNPYTGAYGATKQGSNAYSQWGSSVVSKGGQSAYAQHYSTAQGTAASVQTSSGGKAAGVNTSYGGTAAGKTASGDMYAGHDGNVYKNTGSGWEKYNNGSWNSVNKPTTATGQQAAQQQRSAASQEATQQQRSYSSQSSRESEETQRLQHESQNRQRGEQSSQRSEEYQRSRSGGWGGERNFGGGGGRGGGRGRR